MNPVPERPSISRNMNPFTVRLAQEVIHFVAVQLNIMSRSRSRSPRRHRMHELTDMELTWEELSWENDLDWAVVPPECIDNIVFMNTCVNHSNMSMRETRETTWSTCLMAWSSDSEDEDHATCQCCCGHWMCPCCGRMMSEEEHIRENHDYALSELSIAEYMFWFDVEQFIMEQEDMDLTLMDQLDRDEIAVA